MRRHGKATKGPERCFHPGIWLLFLLDALLSVCLLSPLCGHPAGFEKGPAARRSLDRFSSPADVLTRGGARVRMQHSRFILERVGHEGASEQHL